MICAKLGCGFPLEIRDVDREGEFLVVRRACLNGHDVFESCRDPDAPPDRPDEGKHRERTCGACGVPLVDRGYLYALCAACRIARMARRHGLRGDQKRCVRCGVIRTKPNNYSWARWQRQEACSRSCATRMRA